VTGASARDVDAGDTGGAEFAVRAHGLAGRGRGRQVRGLLAVGCGVVLICSSAVVLHVDSTYEARSEQFGIWG
jgi:hypothetical protein